jgi:uncharacterized protein (TIGR03435 family)
MGESGDFEATNMPLRTLIATAYSVKISAVEGGPGWIRSETFDVRGKPSTDLKPGAASKEAYADAQLMLQTLLEDRYALKVHIETRELPIYALVIAKGGLKVKPPVCQKADDDDPPSSPAPDQTQPAYCGNLSMRRSGQNRKMVGTGITMADLVRALAPVTDRHTIIDRSEYTQPFNATLEWAPDEGQRRVSLPDGSGSAAPSADATGASLFTSLQEQLGLKLEPTKGPVDVLVIDHVEKPTPN